MNKSLATSNQTAKTDLPERAKGLLFELLDELNAKSLLPQMTHHLLDMLIALSKFNNLALTVKVTTSLLLDVKNYDVLSRQYITVYGKEKVILLHVVRLVIEKIHVLFVWAHGELGILLEIFEHES